MSVYGIGPFQLNAERLSLVRDGKQVPIGPKVVETLRALVERPHEALTKSALLDRIWPEGFVEEANLAQNVYVLRKTFRKYGCADPIETVPGHGYRFTAPVSRLVYASRAQLRPRRVAAAIAGVAVIAASLVLAASNNITQHKTTLGALSENGMRMYEIGRYYWDLRTREGVQKSFLYFSRVIDTDPYDARGYAALADANVTMGDYCFGTHAPAVYFARAREYVKKALTLDLDSAEAHAALGFLALHRRDTAVGLTELQQAIVLDPLYSDAHEWYGIALLRRGQSSEGLRHLKIAADLDPLSVATIAWLGAAAYRDRRFSEAIVYSRQALELSPQRTDALRTIGETYEAQGHLGLALEAFKRYAAVDPYYRPEAALLLAQAYALGHRMSEARAQLIYARAHASDVDGIDLVAAAAAVGDRNVSLDMVRRMRTHISWMALENAAHFDALQLTAERNVVVTGG
jgi:DNA-binding winged helix-turn-helix (wHTH) protein/Tfp pilus assembly protein PilF